MILRVGSPNIDTFKAVTFKPGLNLIVADKAEESTDLDTRNGVGKTLLVDIIHFCLGGSFDKDGPLANLVDRQARFFVETDVKGARLIIGREVKRDSPVQVSGLPAEWLSGRNHTSNLLDESVTMKASVLNEILGEHWFGLSPFGGEKYAPTFRALMGFVARNGKGAFLEPFETFANMPAWQKQVLNAYVLRLGWEFAAKWQEWKDKADRYSQARKAMESGLLPGFGTPGELESELTRLRAQHGRVKRDLDNFKVLEEYDEIKRRANRITREMQERQNENVADADLLRMYEANLEVEEDTEPENLVRMFEDAGVVFGDSVKRTLDEVKQFHRELVVNRRRFLEQEISAISRRIDERQAANAKADEEKSELLGVLKTAGALDEYTELQNQNAKLAGDIQALQQRIQNIVALEQTKSDIDEERVELEKATRNDHLDRRTSREQALGIFDEYVRALYDCNGDLVIDVEKTGFKFASKVERDNAEGIGKMEIFCYDLLTTRLWSQQESGPRFLVHDTTLYDGVEERQRGHALELAWSESESLGFQYISLWNSDYLPDAAYLGKLDLSEHIVLRLDDTEAGSLMGFRF